MPTLRSFRSDFASLEDLASVLALPVDELVEPGPTAAFPSDPFEFSGVTDADAVVEGLRVAAELAAAAQKGAESDNAEMVESIHKPLSALSRQAAADRRFWTWLACGYGRDYVWRRWVSNEVVPKDVEAIKSGVGEGERRFRFRMSSASLNGVSRHALARLWWLGTAMGGDYELAGRALHNQDVFQALFERNVGMIPALPRVLLDVARIGTEDQSITGEQFRGEVMVAVQQLAEVTRLEALEESELRELVEQVISERLGNGSA